MADLGTSGFMILTCPACATRYMVDPAVLGEDGRAVRCAKCGETWRQQADADAPPAGDLAPAPDGIRPIPPGSNLPVPAPAKHSRRPLFLGLGVAAALLAVGIGAAVMRDELVAAWPASARLYDAVGLPVETLGAGLQLQNVRSERRDDGEASEIVIQGQIANVSDVQRSVPMLRAVALDAEKRELRDWSIPPSQIILLPGEVATFESLLSNPEPSISEIAITFRDGG